MKTSQNVTRHHEMCTYRRAGGPGEQASPFIQVRNTYMGFVKENVEEDEV